MANFEIAEKPEFTREIRKFEVTDPGHADLFNAVIGPLLQNEVFLKSFADKLNETIIDTYQQATGYTDQEIAKLINGAPTTLDTLGEIATAMQANQDVVSALNQAIGTKANQAEMDSQLGTKLNKTGDASETSVVFSQASARANLASGEKLKVSLGKIMKWFADLANGAASTLLGANLTANRALVANASGKVAAAGVSSTELGYLSGVTSGIQGQLNSLNTGKAATNHSHSYLPLTGGTMTGKITVQNYVDVGIYGVNFGADASISRYGYQAKGDVSINSTSGNVGVSTGAFYVHDRSSAGWATVYASSFSQQSSKRYKENFSDIAPKDAAKLLKLAPKHFDYISGGKNQSGFIAEDVEPFFPEICAYQTDSETGEKKLFGLDYSKFSPYIVKLLQVQEERIERLEGQIKKEKIT